MNVAYVRVSTAEQNEARQKEALAKYDIEKFGALLRSNSYGSPFAL